MWEKLSPEEEFQLRKQLGLYKKQTAYDTRNDHTTRAFNVVTATILRSIGNPALSAAFESACVCWEQSRLPIDGLAYCGNCGDGIPDSSKYCPGCGLKF